MMYLGCTYILHPAFAVESVIHTIETEQVTHIVMVPAQIIEIIRILIRLACPHWR